MENVRKNLRGFGVVLVVLFFSGVNAFAGLNEDLLNAAKNGNINKAKTLISKGANANAKEKDGGTALMFAAEEGYPDIVKLLIDKGANVNAKDKKGKTALMYAKKNGYTDVIKFLKAHGAKE